MIKRIIPLFLLSGNRLVKGTNFSSYIDTGDPLSQAKIYDAQGADEIIILDINASKSGKVISSELLRKIASACKLPICAGGGIKTLQDARELFLNGADRVVINTHALLNPDLIKHLADEFGSQAIIVSIDVKKTQQGKYKVYIFSGKVPSEVDIFKHIELCIKLGAGEIMLTSIDKEGTLSGFDIELYKSVRERFDIPLIASGGAGNYEHIATLFEKVDCEACAIGKMLFLRDYDIVRIKSYLIGKAIIVRNS
ncbi:MAG: imidazole glycerol phosphate synthase cyclase subunit [Aquificaceae bacterium]|nr:imidazole glycerol phosphate synthase cyclase subunit [Aquificaceae bacterium]MDW8237833.1 imidazole glycerol phosphate synthase cyclase subunit [Aquificaceae bacterium]